jgi:hypothetical protein
LSFEELLTPNRTSTVIVVLFYLLIAQRVSSHIALCFGADGHVAVEAASARCCYPSSLSTPPEIAALYSFLKDISNEDNCDPCPGQYLVPTQAASLQMNMCEFTPFLFSVPASVEIATQNLLSQQSPTTNSTLASLRTVILLI